MEEALKSPYFDDVRNEECEVVAQEEMTFPFEHETNLGDSMEKKKIRQLIYNEALLFHQENVQQEMGAARQARHRSFTMGSIPDHRLRSGSTQFVNRPGSDGDGR